ncbi:MAG: hypothetical protein PHQ75_10140, partial [Thermoguttaceae bacterium]|nr:hypothetical protein [Thermoguttaceae bacterium]
VSGMLDGLKTSVNTKLDEQVKTLDLLKDKFEKNPFGPMLDVLFASLHPVAKGSQVALVLDSQNLLDNASTFVPLFGGVSAVMPEKKPGEADVDMFGESEAAPDGKAPTAKPGTKPDAAKPAAAPAAKPAAEPAPAAKPAPGADPKKAEPKKSKKDDDPFA